MKRVIEPIQVKNNERFGILEAEMGELKDLLKSDPGNVPPTVLAHPVVVLGHYIQPSPDDLVSTLSKAVMIISLRDKER